MKALADEAPANLRCLVEYFDGTYVNGGALRSTPRFPPMIWNVHDATVHGRDRTNNQCESWNATFKSLVGHANPSLWTVVKCIDKDAHMVAADILRVQRGEPPSTRSKPGTKIHQARMKTLCEQYGKMEKTLQEFLCGVGEAIRMV